MRNLLLTVAPGHVALHFILSTLHLSLFTLHFSLFTFHFSLSTTIYTPRLGVPSISRNSNNSNFRHACRSMHD